MFLLYFGLNKKPSVSSEDERYLKAFLNEWHITETPAQVHQSFEQELAFVSKIQDSIIGKIKHQEIPLNDFGSIKYYFKNRKGYCYDRAAILEKIFMLYGFPFRHVFIYYNNGKNTETTLKDFFQKKTGSHAEVEIETKKGWMSVGTNCNWLGITRDGKLLTVGTLKTMLSANEKIDMKKQPCFGSLFWDEHPKFHFVYGVYSRHGSFFSPHIGLPEINFKMLIYNF